MELPISTPTKDFQVAGISRSGRVRKKSSKLLDFESPEEIEKRTKRSGRQPRYAGRGRPPNAWRDRERGQEQTFTYEEEEEEEELEHAEEEEEQNQEVVHNHNLSDFEDDDALEEEQLKQSTQIAGLLNSDDEVDTLVQDLVEGVEAEACYTSDSRVRQSLYMREKCSNKRRDGKLVGGKMQRKDKGRARFTAYSMWSREARKRDFNDLDFANAARRLSELWANVSNKDKNAWRRKAKAQATKARTREKNAPVEVAMPRTTNNGNTASTTALNATDNTFMNRATTSRTRKLAADRRQLPETTAPVTWAQSRQKRTATNRIKASPIPSTTLDDLDQSKSPQQQQVCIEAIDAAAHLKLLGESLTVIGERLKEHNGHVALSGSLSVLLDSLLCSMGPLLCMTTQIPGLENKIQLSTNLATTLDNIAYVMPGL